MFCIGRSLVITLLSLAPMSELLAQDPSVDALTVMTRWADLVRAGAADAARQAAGYRFQYQIDESYWRTWVEKNSERLRELGPRQVLESAYGRDQPPLEDLEWSRVLFASKRSSGGRILEQVRAVRDPGGDWELVDYHAWPDGEAVVNNAYLDPIPYRLVYYPGGRFVPIFRVPVHSGRPTRPMSPPAPPPPARANPNTFPKKPPA